MGPLIPNEIISFEWNFIIGRINQYGVVESETIVDIETPSTNGASTIEHPDGGYITMYPTSGQDIKIFHSDVNGEVLWSKFISHPEKNVRGHDIIYANSGDGFIISGKYSTVGFSKFHPFVQKFDWNGEINWNVTFKQLFLKVRMEKQRSFNDSLNFYERVAVFKNHLGDLDSRMQAYVYFFQLVVRLPKN